MRSADVRQPAVAGQFYPASPARLLAGIDAYLHQAQTQGSQPPAIIVPHAGHIYSGPVAASAYRLVRHAKRVVMMGPSHFAHVMGIAGTAARVWRTPLGDVPIDVEALAELPGIFLDERPHEPEHCLEVQVPFLQRVLEPGWRLVPLLAGRVAPSEAADVLGVFLQDPDTITVLSTDLSHYLPYAQAQAKDQRTAERIVARDWWHIADDDACGAYPLRGLLYAAHAREMEVDQLDLRSSGDTAGTPDRVVGYGAFTVGA